MSKKVGKNPALVAFGAAVRRRRMDEGFSQEAFADACELDRSYMGGVERGERNLSLVNIMRVLKGLGVQPSVFFKDLDAPSVAASKKPVPPKKTPSLDP